MNSKSLSPVDSVSLIADQHMLTIRNRLLGIAVAAVYLLVGFSNGVSAATKPNVIVIVADDLGWRDLGVLGASDLKTPHLDALASNGVRCVRGYATAPICSPSRAALMTGRYQQRFGHETNPGTTLERHPVFGLPPTESTLGNRMKDLGYTTGWIGKSHLGGVTNLYHPLLRGFDEFFGFIESHHNYFDTNVYGTNITESLAGQEDPILRGWEPVRESNYLTFAFARECTNFIARQTNGPFFLYAPFNATHFPLQAPSNLLARFSTNTFGNNQNRYTNAAVLAGLDDAVGGIVAQLRAMKIESNTLIFFTSDNGGATNFGSINAPLRGTKTDLYEGGVRVPFLVSWPGHLATNQVFTNAVSALDILPTAVAAAGGSLPAAWQLDGVNLLPHLATNGVPHPRLFWRVETDGINPANDDDVKDGERAVLEGNWKLVKPTVEETWELYNLASDPGEATNVAAANPNVVQRLVAAYDDWNGQLARPNYARNKVKFATLEFVREDIALGATNLILPTVPPVFPTPPVLITDEAGSRTDESPFLAPEFNNELCFAAVVNHTAIAIYRDLHDNTNGWFRRVATLTPPTNTTQPYLYSMRPVSGQRGFNGVSYFTAAAFENDNPSDPGDSGVWLFGFGPSTNNLVTRRLDEGAAETNRYAGRRDPFTVLGAREVFCYYTNDNSGVHFAKTGLKRPDSFDPASGFTSLQFTRSFTAGTNDGAGRRMGGTETRQLVAHDGRLFAGTGVRRFDPYPQTTNDFSTNWTGAQILVKDSATNDWRVDALAPPIFLAHLQVDALESVTFTTRANGQPLANAVNLLVAGLTDFNTNGATVASVRTRLPGPSGGWEHSTVVTSTAPANVISFGSHVDLTNGTHFIFAGLENGEIYRGVLNSNASGLISWVYTNRELAGGGPVTSFADCNRRLYAVSGLLQTNANSVVSGGLFVRVDGSNVWKRIYQWHAPADVSAAPQDQRLALGLTTAPNPDGSSNGVLLLCRAWPGLIERVDPAAAHAVTVELDVRDYFARRWQDNRVRGSNVTIGYTGFTAATNPVTGEAVALVGVWIEHPDTAAPPFRGTHFLIRHLDGTYEAADVANDWPAGALRATRCIAASPFAEDRGGAFYFGGFDTGDDSSTNTAWMLRGKWTAWPRLEITRPDSSSLQLTWPVTGTNWALESSTNLSATLNWQAMPGRPTRSLTNETRSAEMNSPATLYRLRRP